MDQLSLLEPLNLKAINLNNTWRKWKQRFKVSSLASSLGGKDVKVQAATFLHVVTPEALEVNMGDSK